MTQSREIHPEVKRFIDEAISVENSHQTLGGKNFSEIVQHAKENGYEISDTELLNGLNQYYSNKFSLPYWLEKRLGGLAIWAAWEDRSG